MPIKKLTTRLVMSLEVPSTGQIDYWDQSKTSFGIRVSKGGQKTWTLLYRINRRQRRLKLGTFPTMGLADARERARKALLDVADGRDPAAEKIAARHAKTFAQLADEYMEHHAIPKKKSWRNDLQMIKHDLLPRWKDTPPSLITRGDVRNLLEDVVARKAGVHANRIRSLVRKMFRFAIERDWLENNPCRDLSPPTKECPRDRVLSNDEIRRVWEALESESPMIRAKFQLMLLTAQRGGEVSRMRWSDIDLVSRIWDVPAEHAKNKKAHEVPLVTQSVSILKKLRAWQEQRLVEINLGRAKKHKKVMGMSENVFPSARGEGPMLWTQKAAQRVRQSSGVDFRPHDLRRTATSNMTAHKTPRLIVKKILNHADRDVTAIYDRSEYRTEKRKALTEWARRLDRIVNGAKERRVLRFKGSRAS